MTLRRLTVTAPLALLVAILAHLAEFGSDHELGGEYGLTLLVSSLGALLALAALAALTVALGGPRSLAEAARDLRAALPGSGATLPFAAWLLAGGLGFFGSLEALEGHAAFGDAWIAPLCAALSLGIALAVRATTAWLARAGLALAALTREVSLGTTARFVTLEVRSLAAHAPVRDGSLRGRAPPRLS